MTSAILLDTSAWFAALSPRVREHAAAYEALAAIRRSVRSCVTTNLVLAELHGLLTTRVAATAALAVLDQALTDPRLTIIRVDAELELAAVTQWLRTFRDRPFSLCDAVSFEVMRREGIREAFTLDRHFVVAGYRVTPVPAAVREEVQVPANR